MKKKIVAIGLGICMLLNLNGCGKIHWSYGTTVKAINNEYFQTEIVLEDNECKIIRNKITGQYFILVYGTSGLTLCPIEVNENEKGFLISEE